ncbi:hypothetical protein CXZ10_07275 [Pleomorphomonas diazotrophica]|uniref:DUF4345 domain-containing protein n=1 Tax=Pleomorphomonas diazotrophica TaxID=1166257 RepID=A0A1I4S4M5_9HYPH|nr:hypothetical protein [Pleomorphomonas diazotrophica]PKR89971.1 hypothetical protein CXZ10_07275 [Pleomorphomonas diazotrophica]SFM59230.1 hypothetical protein SAMN05192571_10316 [Pleomorphomonas diazotrophica]
MRLLFRLAFVGYALAILQFAGIGIVFLMSDRLMPYHLAAMGTQWEAMAPGMQTMSLDFMKSAGAGFLMVAVAATFLLIIPYRRGEAWANWALAAILLGEFGLILSRMIDVATNTPGRPVFGPFVALGAITLASFLLSLVSRR